MKRKLEILKNGLFKENPVLILILGCCSVLAVSVTVLGGLGMGLALTFVLVCSNVVISLLRNIIPDKVRIPCYIVIIATFVTLVEMLVKAFLPSLYESLGVFLSLIVVNCIVLGRAEMFASKNSVVDSLFDGIGMVLGFTLALFLMGVIREFLGAGTFLGMEVTTSLIDPMTILTMAPGGFFVFGCLIAIMQAATKGKALKAKSFSCGLCPMYNSCNTAEANEELAAEKKAAAAV